MIVTYRFVNGETMEIEASQEIGEALVDMDRRERNSNQTETRRHVSLDMLMWDYDAQFSTNQVLDQEVELQLEIEHLKAAIGTLPPRHQKLLSQVFHEGRSISSIAREEHVHESSVRERLMRIYKRMKKSL